MNEFETKKEGFFNKYKDLPLEEKINVIAKTFGYESGTIERKICHGRWRGGTDVHIHFLNGPLLYIGTKLTPETRKKSIQTEMINVKLMNYNPEIVQYCKELAWENLKKLEILDNSIAAEQGLKPYELCEIELHNQTSDFIGWYQVVLLVDGKRVSFRETNLYFGIKNGYTEKFLEKAKYHPVD